MKFIHHCCWLAIVAASLPSCWMAPVGPVGMKRGGSSASPQDVDAGGNAPSTSHSVDMGGNAPSTSAQSTTSNITYVGNPSQENKQYFAEVVKEFLASLSAPSQGRSHKVLDEAAQARQYAQEVDLQLPQLKQYADAAYKLLVPPRKIKLLPKTKAQKQGEAMATSFAAYTKGGNLTYNDYLRNGIEDAIMTGALIRTSIAKLDEAIKTWRSRLQNDVQSNTKSILKEDLVSPPYLLRSLPDAGVRELLEKAKETSSSFLLADKGFASTSVNLKFILQSQFFGLNEYGIIYCIKDALHLGLRLFFNKPTITAVVRPQFEVVIPRGVVFRLQGFTDVMEIELKMASEPSRVITTRKVRFVLVETAKVIEPGESFKGTFSMGTGKELQGDALSLSAQ